MIISNNQGKNDNNKNDNNNGRKMPSVPRFTYSLSEETIKPIEKRKEKKNSITSFPFFFFFFYKIAFWKMIFLF